MGVDNYEALQSNLRKEQYTWLITGVAGFIGSNLLEILLKLNQKVVGLDNFSTGFQRNLDEVKSLVTFEQWRNFNFIMGDIRSLDDCRQTCRGADYVLHQAALGSVPRSVEDPIATNSVNITGFLNMLVAARDAKVKRFIYAASSSTYGDHPDLPKVEDKIGRPLSPYAITKYVNELYADIFAHNYAMETIGLRYFNVFGPRQDPNGAYAAVIPKWIVSMIRGEPVYINGDGETSRDFCYIENVQQINLLAATTDNRQAINQVYNVAIGDITTLNQLYELIQLGLLPHHPNLKGLQPNYRDSRVGDVLYSQANITKAIKNLGYMPMYNVAEGLELAMDWYESHLNI